jgi:PEP-CTERM motif
MTPILFNALSRLLPVRRLQVVALACLLGALPAAQAEPCSRIDPTQCPSDPSAFRVRFNLTSTTPQAITTLFDFWGSQHVAEQGQFSIDSPPSLPTGSGTLDAGYWLGEDSHFLAGITVDSSGVKHLVLMMDPTTAALMVNRSFDDMINGIPPLGQPNPFPVVNAEQFIIDRIENRPAEFQNDVWTLFEPLYHPNRLDPSVAINRSSGPTTLTMVRFSTGSVIGTVGVEISPVPEPATWVGLLAGIGLFSLWRRGGMPARG